MGDWIEENPAHARPSSFAQVWEATVTSVTGGVHVKIPQLTGNALEYGPCRVLEAPWSTGELATVTGAASAGAAHTHPINVPPALAKDNEVLVAFLSGRRDRVVIIGRLTD
jgi:hypothetical protein